MNKKSKIIVLILVLLVVAGVATHVFLTPSTVETKGSKNITDMVGRSLQTPASLSLGASFLLLIDNISRALISIEIPIGILTAMISIIIVLLSFGGIINEFISRKAIKSKELEELIRNVSFSRDVSQMKGVINDSNLSDYQKDVLIRIADNYDIGSDARKALASELISAEETRLIKSTNKTDIFVKVGPILGLLGTLIPLGPGLAALGSGDIAVLAQSLTIAFDTAVTGLSVGALAYVISRFKKQWYESDLIAIETVAEAELETINRW